GRFIRKTVESVLGQAYPRLNYLVQDGGSSDETVSVLSGFGSQLNWVSEPDEGQADAINRAFRRVDAEIMAWLNSDDLLLPGALGYVGRFFARHPEVDLIYGHRIYIDADGREIGRMVLPPHDGRVLKWQDYIPQETMFWRRKVWQAIGPLDTAFDFAL